MKKIIQGILVFSLSFLVPGIITMVMTGTVNGNQKEMGKKIIFENGECIDGEQFVIGMAATELSYIKEEEAIKAWIIVCRTNLIKAMGDVEEVNIQDLSLDYVSEEELESNYGKKAWLTINSQLKEASEETFGQVLYYDDVMIDALYHPVSIGKTVSASEMYSVEVPYLISVDSSQDVESSDYMEVKIMTYKACAKKLKENGYEETTSDCKKNLEISEETENGYVLKVTTKKNEWTGEEWKDIFSLNSTNFYLEDYGGRFRIVTIGKGHGMGMSLYGANVLAEKGLSSETILSYYFPGTKIKNEFSEKE